MNTSNTHQGPHFCQDVGPPSAVPRPYSQSLGSPFLLLLRSIDPPRTLFWDQPLRLGPFSGTKNVCALGDTPTHFKK